VTADVEWHAGDLGCGDLVLQLMVRMNAMGAGEVLRLVALDPGAPADIPAWCRMTGHTLIEAEPPTYLIRRSNNE
jgi:tRNA 2-thiouridine synthesizing protein A